MKLSLDDSVRTIINLLIYGSIFGFLVVVWRFLRWMLGVGCWALVVLFLTSDLCPLTSSALADLVPQYRWTVHAEKVIAQSLTVRRGETLDLVTSWRNYGVAIVLSNATSVVLHYRAASLPSAAIQTVTGAVTSATGGVTTIRWTPACEAANAPYTYDIAATSANGSLLRGKGSISLDSTVVSSTNPAPTALSTYDWLTVLATVQNTSGSGVIPEYRWIANAEAITYQDLTIRRGESLDLVTTWRNYGAPLVLTNVTAVAMYYRPVTPANLSWSYIVTGAVDSVTGGVTRIRWTSTCESTNTLYNYDILIGTTNSSMVRVKGRLLLDSSLVAGTNAPPQRFTILDWAAIQNLNVGSCPFASGLGYSTNGHQHAWSAITNPPTTLAGYGITDAVTSSTYNSGTNAAIADATGRVAQVGYLLPGSTQSLVTASVTNNCLSTNDNRACSLDKLMHGSNWWVDANGNVGIGTNNPSGNALYLFSTNALLLNRIRSSDPTATVAYEAYNGSQGWQFGVRPELNNGFFLYGGISKTYPWIVTTNGNVGINTTNPSTPLDVNGDATIRGKTTINVTNDAGANGVAITQTGTSRGFYVTRATQGTRSMVTFNQSGVGGNSQASLEIQQGNSTNIAWGVNDGQFGGQNGYWQSIMLGNGWLGLCMSNNPASPLDVNGDATIRGNMNVTGSITNQQTNSAVEVIASTGLTIGTDRRTAWPVTSGGADSGSTNYFRDYLNQTNNGFVVTQAMPNVSVGTNFQAMGAGNSYSGVVHATTLDLAGSPVDKGYIWTNTPIVIRETNMIHDGAIHLLTFPATVPTNVLALDIELKAVGTAAGSLFFVQPLTNSNLIDLDLLIACPAANTYASLCARYNAYDCSQCFYYSTYQGTDGSTRIVKIIIRGWWPK